MSGSGNMKRRAAGAVLVLSVVLPSAWVRAEVGVPGELVGDIGCRTDPTQTYSLYLPSRYDPGERWPVLLVFDPRGRSRMAAELFVDAAERYGWIILSSDNTRSDGPWEPNVRAVNAMWPDATSRFSADTRRMYAAGFSGGAHVAWLLAQTPGTLAGVIASGGRFAPSFFEQKSGFAHFGAAGDTDFNYRGMETVDALVEERGQPHRFEVFEGDHRWMTPALARLAVGWQELMAMKGKLRPVDAVLVARLMEEDLARARQAESDGRLVAAAGAYRTMLESYQGLLEVEGVRGRLLAIESSPAYREEAKEERRAARFETGAQNRVSLAFARFQDPEVAMSSSRFLHELRVAELKKQAAGSGAGALAARRVLESAHTLAAFYRTRDLLARGLYGHAETVLEVALEIKPDRADTWYNLACAHARQGHLEDAMHALGRAIGLGYADAEHLRSDPDLDSLHGQPGFAQILRRFETGPDVRP